MSHATGHREQILPVVPSRGTLRGIGLEEVTLTGGYWLDRQDINARNSIPHAEEWIERLGWIGNFDAAVEGRLPADAAGPVFSDSDVYKLIEAMAWEIGRSGDAEMDARLVALVNRIAPVQEEDGYLNTKFGRPGQPPRYSDLEWGHELYCYGHLIQAAVARGRSHGEDLLVRIARRAADHVCEVFGADGIQRVCGHPEIEVALVEFARYTGQPRYLEQARLFIERRGHGTLGEIPFGPAYFQDEVPVRETTVMSGHAVRALYLAAGAIDVAIETGDDELLEALIRQTSTTVARRTYITGGMGAHHEGESFGLDYELPPDRAYSETCAGVGSVMVNHRLLLATGDARYADLIERTLYNVIAASSSRDGLSFFYTNTLHQRQPGIPPAPDSPSPRASSSLRAPWFEVSCCPTNVARTVASLGSYLATTDDTGLQIHQYADATIRVLLDGEPVGVTVSTEYPRDGHIRIEVTEAPEAEWTLSLRVPGWATDSATLTVGGTISSVAPGTVAVTRVFSPGDVLDLDLPVASRWTTADPRVDAVRGSVAVERGPLVLCLESVDLVAAGLGADITVNDIRVDVGLPPTDADGVTTIALARGGFADAPWPYAHDAARDVELEEPLRVPLIPYNEWANRGSSTMRVWMPVAP